MKSLKRIGAGLLAGLVLVMPVSMNAYATSTGTQNYVTGDDSYRMPIPQCYNVVDTINNIGSYEDEDRYFKNPQDIFVDSYDNIYIVDTGNDRVIKMNSSMETLAIFYGDEESGKFNDPEGIFVEDDGDMYLADTGNKRILHLSPEGKFVEQFNNPDSELTSGAAFNPSKLVVSPTGYMYVIRGENIMAIDGSGGFSGLYGQTDIGYDLTEMILRMVASEEQKRSIAKRTASSYINLTMGKDGMIYATSMEREEGEIKKLNSIGTNVYRKYKTVGNSISNPITDFIENKLLKSVVASNSFKFGEYFDDDGMYMEPIFRDIAVDDDGIVTVIEEQNGKVYQYDQEGNMLVAFGGLGESAGTFTRPAAIDVDSKGNLYILDRINANVQIFEPTEFILLVHQATTRYGEGDYANSFVLWQQVLDIDENYDLAHVGIAKTYYKQGEFKLSMDESKLVGNRDVYTQAFDEYSYVVLRRHFVLILFLALAIIVGLYLLVTWLIRTSKKAYWNFLSNKTKKMGIIQGLKYAFHTILHPIDAMEGIRYNKANINMAVPFLLFLIAYVVRIAYIYIVHFPLASIEVADANLVFEAVKLLIVPISWIPASFAATSISDGETKFPEITFTSALSLAPYIVINLPLMFLSNIWSKSQQSWYGVFSVLAYIGMFLILFIAMMVLNNYTLKKTIGMMIVSAGMMLVIWLVLGLVYVLTGRMIQFVFTILNEFKLNFL